MAQIKTQDIHIHPHQEADECQRWCFVLEKVNFGLGSNLLGFFRQLQAQRLLQIPGMICYPSTRGCVSQPSWNWLKHQWLIMFCSPWPWHSSSPSMSNARPWLITESYWFISTSLFPVTKQKSKYPAHQVVDEGGNTRANIAPWMSRPGKMHCPWLLWESVSIFHSPQPLFLRIMKMETTSPLMTDHLQSYSCPHPSARE